ncbi:MAG: hypothetical protein J6N47_02505 [Lachnospiraceae bacterium]|nr:hypothetical protein [Lachnospiraceae bacterium]
MFYKLSQTIGLKDVDKNCKVKNVAILEMLENAAGGHSDAVGYGMLDIDNTGITFVLLDWYVRVLDRPGYGEALTVSTWGRPEKRMMSLIRDYELRDSDDKLRVLATSRWVIIDINRHRITRVTPEVLEAFGAEEKQAFETDPMVKIDRPKAASEDTADTAPVEMGTSIVGRSALDLVGHVHNIKYIDMAEDMMPDDIWTQAPFDNFRIHYRKEITEGEKIRFNYSFVDNLKHEIRMENEDGELNAIVRMWNTPLT